MGWVHCPARCGRAPGPDQLILRMTRSPATAIGVGSSLMNPVLQAGRLATVYVDQVDAMARRSNTDREAILVGAIAHEIGHLLLGTAEHTQSGLMRGICGPLKNCDAIRWRTGSSRPFSARCSARASRPAARRGGTPGFRKSRPGRAGS